LAFSEESVSAVKAWLISVGVSADRIRQSHGLSWLHFNASVGEAESLLRAKYHFWKHDRTGNTHVACDEYSLPQGVRKHIDFVLPSVHFDSRIGPRGESHHSPKEREDHHVRIGDPESGWLPKAVQSIDKSDLHYHLVGCDQQTTPACLRALYGIPINEEAVEGNSFGVAEFTPQAYIPTDLDIFFSNFSDRLVGERPITRYIQGAIVQQQNKSCGYNCESNLDLEYAMTLVYPQQVTLYQVGNVIGGASFNAIYPDPTPGGYKGAKTCGAFNAAKVVTISYAYNEHDLMPAYEQRQCNEYLKLGLMGTSFLVSSGDNGVAGNGDQCIDASNPLPGANATYTDGRSSKFNPMFPAGCPYVTAVGATQVVEGTDIARALAARAQPEETLAKVAFSGGGFSNVFALPDYQAETVKEWFSEHPPAYGSDRFNNSQKTRGFPDISANGANYAFAVNAEWSLTYGTSASAPVLGSILTLINQERLKAGKSSIGFINPTAYAHPEVFNDVTVGNNGGCGVEGWHAVVGWDPVTGLGTPDYPRMLELWMSLP
jgi:tripeptidyl-peptidase-1